MKSGFTATTAAVGVIATLTLTACGTTPSAPAAFGLTVESMSAGDFALTWSGAEKATVFASTSAADPSSTGEEVADVDGRSAEVTDLDPVLRWYFEARNGDNGGTVASTRQFTLQGAHNVRDIGGYRTADGQSIAWGKVFRGDTLTDLTADDLRAVEGANVGTVVDFRSADEIARSGADKLPAGVELVNTPLLDENTQALSEAIQSAMTTGDGAAMEATLGGGKAMRIADESFVNQLGKPDTMAGYGETLRLIADSGKAVIYHCTAGKDRTGMMTALLLGLLGVPDETIVEDFVASNTYNREHNDKTYAFLAGKGVDIELIRPLMEQSAGMIQPVLDAVHNEYGGWDEFAKTVLGLDTATLTKLRDSMLTV